VSRILITGARGFVGSALCPLLQGRGHIVEAAAQRLDDPQAVWPLAGIDAVVHLAARVHVMQDDADDPWEAFRRVNTEGTRRLAEQAAAAGVRRLVFLSSIKVNGEATKAADAFREDGVPAPADAYGRSKWQAERDLAEVASATGLEVVILRPPLVYGPGVKANFLALVRACARRLPLPLGAVDNRRSLIGLGNLVDALALCVEHPGAAGRTYLVRDGEDLSTPELVRRLSAALGVVPRLLPVPPALLRLAGGLAGKGPAVERLLGSLTIDDSCIRRELGWVPPETVDDGLAATARWFLATR
jgi:nucleoside-diphosphate-sugar epimerase